MIPSLPPSLIRPCHLLRISPILTSKFSISPTSPSSHKSSPSTLSRATIQASKPLPSRWLTQTKSRLGKCITFGLTTPQVQEAGLILKELATEWRELIAGSEGFLTGEGRRGFWGHAVVWGEMDSMHTGHVNNVVYNRYAESGRVNWASNFATTIDPAHKKEWNELWTSTGTGMILRSIKTEFKFPMTYPDHITVLHKLSSAPTPSTDHFILDVLILSERHQRPAARCVEDIVVYDYKLGKKAPLKPFMVDAFQKIWREQEEVRTEVGRRVSDIEGRVGRLEKESWAKKGAVEDMGSSV